jgi:MFS family permease
MNVRLNKTSTFAALRNPVYRKLWFAILLSGTCVAAQDIAATWTMNMLGSSTFLLSLISTVASLPFFLFTLPAGAFADMVDRRKLLCIMNLWLAGAAVLLAILGSFQLLNPYVLLFCVFLIGVGFAFHALCFIVVILALLQWKGPEAESGFPVEHFLESFSTAVRYVRYSPAIQVVLALSRHTTRRARA